MNFYPFSRHAGCIVISSCSDVQTEIKRGKIMNLRAGVWLAIFVSTAIIGACGGGSGGSGSGGTGTLSLSMADATTDRFKAIYVTIDEVQVHLGGNENSPNNWQSIDMPASPITVNLLELVNGVREELGVAELDEGAYTQMRLIIGRTPEPGAVNILSHAHPYANYVIGLGDETHELKIPSGNQTGFKIVNGFDINARSTTELILDFDAGRSVVEAGASGNWLLKPTVKILYPDDPQEWSIISGKVTRPATQNNPSGTVEGAVVSAQTFSAGPTSAKTDDVLTIQASTLSDAQGVYQLFVRPGTYHLVAYATGETPAFKDVTTLEDDLKTEDFSLATSGDITISGSVTISGGDTEQYATLSFRKAIPGDQMIEIYSVNVLGGTDYSVTLPTGAYTIVASTYGHTSQTVDENATTTNVDFAF